MQKIVFFGSGWYTIPVMQKLMPHGLDLVVTTERNPESHFLKFCSDNSITTLSVSTASEITNHQSQIANHQIAVLASFGAIIPHSILNSFPDGIINIHPSLLPKYKGPSPIQYALLNGENTTGVTLITLDDKVDHGPILSQRPYELQGNETSQDLLSILFEIGAEMIEEQVIKLKNGEKLTSTPQDHSKESWSKKISKKDGYIDIDQLNTGPYAIGSMIKAFYPWPGVWFTTLLKGQSKIVKLLPENKIQIEGKTPMNLKDFENGYGDEGRIILEKLGLN